MKNKEERKEKHRFTFAEYYGKITFGYYRYR